MAQTMKNLKKRNNRKLRCSKKGKVKNRFSREKIIAAIEIALEASEQEILTVARLAYSQHGRGCINTSVKNHPSIPHKRGYFDYETEADYKAIQSRQGFLTARDKAINESLASYDPTRQAVVCVWHETMYFVTIITDTFAVFDSLMYTENLVVH